VGNFAPLLGIGREKDGVQHVNYIRVLQRFRAVSPYQHRWQKAVLGCVFDSLLRADLALSEALAAIDRNQDGAVIAA
jgi:hypothetical protein